MCGIAACVGTGRPVDRLLTGLENLEYRGYDSAGVALSNGGGVDVYKREGQVDQLVSEVRARSPTADVGVGHTRWSTHGAPSDRNAHPHTDCEGRVAVVHNGIIENYGALRTTLREWGHEFESDTDTEVVPHLVGEGLDNGLDPETAFRRAIAALDGSYAIAMLVAGEDAVYATRQGSPLVLGIGEEGRYLASDVPAFREFTDTVVYLDDGDVVEVTPDGHRVTDADGRPRSRPPDTVDWAADDAEKGRYDHFMLKEIHEQPTALRQAIRGRVDDGGGVALEELTPDAYADVDRVHLVACGTSYHAAVYGARMLTRRGIPARAILASEYADTPTAAGEHTLVVGVTQSGETADTLAALREADRHRTLALTNTVGSTAARECDDALFIRAGPEIGVAATKTFSSQVVTLALFAEFLTNAVTGSYSDDYRSLLADLQSLPEQVGDVLSRSRAAPIADRYRDSDAYFFVGRGVAYPVALEGALKLKEISYEHAEGFAAGELKHGPLALVTPDTPVVAVFTGRNADRMRGNVEEIRARGAPVVAVVPEGLADFDDEGVDVVELTATHPDLVGILANVELQLLSYHTAELLDRPIDKPRNLAKSVTVE